MCLKFSSITTLIIFFGIIERAPSRLSVDAAELLADTQNPIFLPPDDFPVGMMKPKQNSFGEGEVDTRPYCHIEYQITRRRLGRCVKLGQLGMTAACVSGQYLNPLHPDCL